MAKVTTGVYPVFDIVFSIGTKGLASSEDDMASIRIWSHSPYPLKAMWKNGARWTREDGAEPWQLPKQLLYP